MRIAFLADPLDAQTAGIHTYARELLRAIDVINPEHEIFIQRARNTNEFSNCSEIAIPINKKIPLHQRLRTFTSIPRAINKLNVDAVIEMAHFGPFRISSSTKRITMIHDLTPLLLTDYHPRKSVIFHKLLLRNVLKNADQIITNSKNSKNDLLNMFAFTEGKISSIPLGVKDKKDFEADNEVLEKFNLTKPFFLNVGTIEPRKNLSLLIKAYNIFRSEHSKEKIGLVIAGKKGWKCESILSEIKSSPFSNSITLTGYVSENELMNLYTRAKAFIYPSHYEGFGLPLLEAMRFGIPVLSADNSSLPEVGGNVALYFKSAEELSHRLTKVLRLSQTELDDIALSGRNRAAEFSWTKTAEQTLELISNVVRNE